MSKKRKLGVVLFDGFELLDVFGPLEMFGLARDDFEIELLAESGPSVESAQGPRSVVDVTFSKAGDYDILLVPGGYGTRKAVKNVSLLEWLQQKSETAEIVTSVCTGAAILASSGLLNGKKATSNKESFTWVKSQGEKVEWVAEARWVEDGKFMTSSGVSAGMDMSLALIQKLLGETKARAIATEAEYEWHNDSSWDPFAKVHGLV